MRRITGKTNQKRLSNHVNQNTLFDKQQSKEEFLQQAAVAQTNQNYCSSTSFLGAILVSLHTGGGASVDSTKKL